MSKFTETVVKEVRELIPPTLFFFIALHVVALMRTLMLEGTGVSPGTTMSVAIASLILGKAVLLADLLPFVNRYPDHPLIYNIAWKSLLYMLMAMLIHYLERLVDFSRKAGGIVAGNEKMLAEMIWPRFWATQLLLAVLILGYCTIREVVRKLGADEARRMFFGPVERKPA